MPSPKRSQKRDKTTTDWSKKARTILRKAIREAQGVPGLRKLGPRGVEWQVGVHLVGAPEMARLNEFYRKKKGPTDVLSFEAPPIFRDQGILGELVICLPVLKKQAREQGHAPKEELQVLLSHGLLHLLGMDHEGRSPQARKKAALMKQAEQKLLRRAGLIKRAGSSKPKP